MVMVKGMTFFSDVKKTYTNKKIVMYVIIALSLILTYCMTTLIFQFRDGTSLNVWSVEFWDVLIYKRMNGFYEYTQQNLRGAPHGVLGGSWLIILPQAIWNFPIWLAHRNPETTDVTGSFCNAWGKLFYVVCFVLLCIYVYKTVMLITENNMEKALIAVILVAGSMEAYASIAFAGQDEVVYMLAMIVAMYYRIKGKWKLSLIFSIVSVTLCTIMIVPIVIMEIFFDKKIWTTLLKCIAMLMPGMIFELVYANNELYQTAKSFNSIGIFTLMMNTGVASTTVGRTSIPMIALIVVVFMAYVSKDENNKKGVFLYTGLGMIILSFFMYSLFYRYWLYIPFVAIYAVCTAGNMSMKAFLMLITGVCRFLSSFTYPEIYSYFYYSPIAQRLLGDNGPFIEVTNQTFGLLQCVINPLAIACVLLVMYISYNRKKKEYSLAISEKILIPIYLGSCTLFFLYYLVWLIVLH